MGYVGNKPALNYTTFAVQHFTTSATTGYTLDHAVTNENDIRLVINNVVQQPGGSYAYTATGTVLTLSAATAGTDTMYCVFIGKAVQTVNPGAASVGTSQLADESVNEAKLKVSNSPTNGYVLSAQSGAAGGLTWAVDAAGTVTGYTNGVDNRVITSSGTTTLNGETNFIYNGTIVGAGADGANADLGEGIHVKTSDIGSVTVDANGKGLVIEKSGSTGLSIITPNDQSGNIFFGDPEEGSQGQIYYSHNDDSMHFKTGAAEKLHLTNAGSIFFPQASQGVYLGVTSATATNLLDDYEEGTWTPTFRDSGGSTIAPATLHAQYTKIGDLVTMNVGVFGWTTFGTGELADFTLPFASGTRSGARATGALVSYKAPLSTNGNGVIIDTNYAYGQFWTMADDNVSLQYVEVDGNSEYFWAASYMTNL